MTVPITAGPAYEADINATVGAPSLLTVVFNGVDWSGSYISQCRTVPGITGDPADVLTATASYSAPDTTFSVTLPADHPLTAGTYYYDVKGVDGSVIIRGRVFVSDRVTIPT